ncbi:MAG: hypothetical protein J6C84_03550 [Lachnospiraceae bacterium]|nr:hypothetical protein [Lachnospiraceae bacterium]
MKCEYCKGNLSLTDAYCPHCGRPNVQAQQHIRDMDRYQGDFEDTRKSVYSIAAKYKEIVTLVVILAGLLFAIALLAVIGASSYSVKRTVLDVRARHDQKEYREILDGYLEDEDFLSFSAFCSARRLSGYDEGYKDYAGIIQACDSYYYFYSSLMQFLNYEKTDGHFQEWMTENLNEVYKRTEIKESGASQDVKDREREVFEAIRNQTGVLLEVYCGLSREEVQSLPDLTNAQRSVLLEERISHGE